MGAIKNLTGEKFAGLTVIEKAEDYYKPQWSAPNKPNKQAPLDDRKGANNANEKEKGSCIK